LSYADHMQRVIKAAGGAPALPGPGAEALWKRWRNEDNGEYAEALWRRLHPDVCGPGGTGEPA